VHLLSDDVYGPTTLTNFLNPAACAQPAGGVRHASAEQLVSLAATRTVELGLEVFNPRIMPFGIKYRSSREDVT
jgi:hypothetical protein